MPKTSSTTPDRPRRHNPLEQDLTTNGILRTKSGKTKKSRGEDEDHYVDSRASQNILRLGRELDEDEEKPQRPQHKPDHFGYDSRFDDEAAEIEAQIYGEANNEEAWGDEDEIVEEVEVDPEDLETYKKFLPEDDDELLKHGWDRRPTGEEEGETVNLADLILAKIAAHEAMETTKDLGGPPDDNYELPPKVVEAYTKIGQILSRYKSGPLPKPFKVLPSIPGWEQIIMECCAPEKWTANACFQATRIFAASKPQTCQRFLDLVILPKVKEDIYENKKLNVHLFNALKKSLYKPGAFFKGFLFPLVRDGCTLREAHIIQAVLARVSIPVLHSAAALKGLCDIAAQEASQGSEGGGAVNIFIKALLEKKYALPYQVIDALVFHFLRFRSVDPASVQAGDVMTGIKEGDAKTKLPVIWHQSLLAFAQRYKGDVTEDQREALLDLLLTHGHSKIGPEVRRELLAGRGRGIPMEPQAMALDGDDTMIVDA